MRRVFPRHQHARRSDALLEPRRARMIVSIVATFAGATYCALQPKAHCPLHLQNLQHCSRGLPLGYNLVSSIGCQDF